MSFRAKLFLLLLSLSVLPILVLRLNNQRTLGLLSDDLVRSSGHLLVAKAKDHLRLMVEDHAQLWRRESQLLEQTLRLQALKAENALAQGGPEAIPAVYRAVAPEVPGLILGQLTVLSDGRILASQDSLRLPQGFDARQTQWYAAAMACKDPVWTGPVTDPVTRRIGLTVSMVLGDGSGKAVGVTALMAPVTFGGASREHTRSISGRLKTYLVAVDHIDDQQEGLRVIGEEGGQEEGPDGHDSMSHGHGRGMMGMRARQWLTPDEPDDLALVLSEIKQGLSEVRQVPVDGRDCLWAYAPSGLKDTALLLIAPKKDVIADATAAESYIESRIAEQLHATWFVVLTALGLITVTAWVLSRSVTRPVMELSRAARRLGEGDFSTRVTPSGSREIRQLGRTFNDMIPQMEDSIRLRQAMALAQEMQRSLLPAVMPVLPGLDIAGASRYCDETGGDYYDAIENAHGQPGRTAFLVGDVSGHGVDAALLMTTARAFLRMRAHQPGTPAQVADEVNAFLAADTFGTGRFMTLFYLELDAAGDPLRSGGQLRWVRAGHDPAMLYVASTGLFEELDGHGIPLGALEQHSYSEHSRPALAPGDVLLIGSDGMWEARDPEGTMFGKERVRSVLRRNAHAPAAAMIAALLDALDAFMAGQAMEDDVTLLVIKATS